MPTPTLPRPKFNFSTVPDPDTLPPDVRAKMLAQPWFNQVLDLHESGVEVTPELMEKLATRPGAMGFKMQEFDAGDGKKMKGLFDVATGELVPPDKLIREDFKPEIKALKDPVTGKPAGSALMTSSNSAVPYEKPDAKAPLMTDFYKASPILDDQNTPIGHVVIGPNGHVNIIKKGSDFGALGALFGQPGTAAKPAGAGPAPVAPTPAQPAPAAPQQTPAFRVTNAEDYARVPSGSVYIDPKGVRRTKP
jgi:hypothetical protein